MIGAHGVYLVLEAVRGLGLGLIVVAPIFRIEVAGFGPLELVLAGTALEIAYFVSEVPTGVVADAYSRRLSVILGALVMGGAWVMEGLWATLWPIMIAQAILGVGWSRRSPPRRSARRPRGPGTPSSVRRARCKARPSQGFRATPRAGSDHSSFSFLCRFSADAAQPVHPVTSIAITGPTGNAPRYWRYFLTS